MFSTRSDQSTQEKFSLENFDFLAELVGTLKADATNPQTLVDAMRELVEVVVWGDKYNESIFDRFMEKNTIVVFAEAVESQEAQTEVKVQCFQCFTILLGNLSRQESIYYVMSKNHINRIISSQLDFDNDEIVSNYISFVKALSLKLNGDLVQFFFEDADRFPLFDCSVRLLDHADRLVRTSVRQIVVNVMRIDESGVQKYVEARLPGFVEGLATFALRSIAELSAALNADNAPSAAVMDAVVEDVNDDLFFINDMYGVTPEVLRGTIVDVLHNRLAQPLFVASRENNDPAPTMALSNWIRIAAIAPLAVRLIPGAVEAAAALLAASRRSSHHPCAVALLANACALHGKFPLAANASYFTTGVVDSVLLGLRSLLQKPTDKSTHVVVASLETVVNVAKIVSNGPEHLERSLRATLWWYQQQLVTVASSEGEDRRFFDTNLDLMYESLVAFVNAPNALFNQVKQGATRVGRDVSYLIWSASIELKNAPRRRNQLAAIAAIRSTVLALNVGAGNFALAIDSKFENVAHACRFGAGSLHLLTAEDCVHCQVCAVDEIDASQKLLERNTIISGVSLGMLLHVSFVGAQLVFLEFAEECGSGKPALVIPLAFACAVVERERPFRLRVTVDCVETTLSPVRELGLLLRDREICRAIADRMNDIALAARRICRRELETFLTIPMNDG